MATQQKQPSKIIDNFVLLRLVVGFLGQGKQSGWWNCDLLDVTGLRFLETIFPRTFRAAALRSTTEAACLTHDKSLGRVGSYHLFRFPPALEDRMEQVIDTLDLMEMSKQIESRELAMNAVRSLTDVVVKAPEGPVQVGVANRILTNTSIAELAAHYHSAFEKGIRCFPYFAPEKK